LHFTTSDGVRLHYLESGAGPTLVFVPGWTMPAEIWQPQIEHFRHQYRVVALDPRSQGESDKPAEGNYPAKRAQDLKEFLEHLGAPAVTLIAWSLAVYEALTYVELHGTERFNGLVLIDFPMYVPSTQQDRDARFAMFHDIQARRREFASAFVRGMYRKPHPEEYLESITTASLKTPTTTAVALLAERAIRTDLRAALPKLNLPVLAVMTSGNRAAAELICANVPGAQTEIFETSGHCLFVDEPNRFNTLLESFLRSFDVHAS
jgi:non-heme chloroperoxidase